MQPIEQEGMRRTQRLWSRDEAVVVEANYRRHNSLALSARILDRTEASVGAYERVALQLFRKRVFTRFGL